jgi:perosamine synthetase
MKKIRIPHNRPTLGRDEVRAASRIIESGWVAQGWEVLGFEKDLCEFLNLPYGHAIMVSSGTAALYIAIKHMRFQNITYPIYSCSSIRNAVLMANCVPIAEDLKAINPDILVHTFGIPETRDSRTYYIEDAAQALGAKIKNQFVGTIGTYGVFSFSATKLITSGGQGGAIVSWNKAIIDDIRDYRQFDMRKDMKARFNFQMTDINAAIGRVQLRKLKLFLERREEIFKKYLDAGFELLQSRDVDKTDVRYRAVLKTDKAEQIIEALAEQGIRAIIPIEESELLGEKEKFPKALQQTRNTLSLPIYPTLSNKEIELIVSVVQKCIF